MSARITAIRNGQSKYDGQPCHMGHSGLRYSVNGACVECANDRNRTGAFVMTKARVQVLALLALAPMSTRDLAAACAVSVQQVSNTLRLLEGNGWVRIIGTAPSRLRGAKPRVCAITPDGMTALNRAPDMSGLSSRARLEVA